MNCVQALVDDSERNATDTQRDLFGGAAREDGEPGSVDGEMADEQARQGNGSEVDKGAGGGEN